MMKITPKQAEKVHRLVKSLCANCDEDGNCILLDDMLADFAEYGFVEWGYGNG